MTRRIITPICPAKKGHKRLNPFIDTTRTFLEKQKAVTEAAALHIVQKKHLDTNPSHWRVSCKAVSSSEIQSSND